MIALFFVSGRLEAVELITQQHKNTFQATNQTMSGLPGQIMEAHRHMTTRIDAVKREQRDTASRQDTRMDEVQREQRDTASRQETRMDEVQREIGKTEARLCDVEGEKV